MTPRERLDQLLERAEAFTGPATIETLISTPKGPAFRRITTLDGHGGMTTEGEALIAGVWSAPPRAGAYQPSRPVQGQLPADAEVEALGSALVAGREGAGFEIRFPGLDRWWLFGEDRADRYRLVVDLETGLLLDAAAYRKRRLVERRQVVRFEVGAPA